MALDPKRTVAELEELRALTGDENGAQRVAWTETWERARELLRARVAATGAREEIDEAGNQWFTLPGRSDKALLIGGHIDSVPNGGWLDGCLNVMAGVEVLRRIAAEGEPPLTVRLVNWADEEGARFGRSLFGSSAAAGSMRDQDELRVAARTATGSRCRMRVGEYGVDARRGVDVAVAARERGGVSRAAHRAGAGARVAGPAARRRARHVRRRALAVHLARPGGARRLDADGQRARRARRCGEARARDPRHRARGRGTARCARRAVSCAGRASSPRSSRPPSSCSTSATSTRRRSRACSTLAREAAERFAAEENIDGRVGADLEHRADPVRRDADRPRRRGGARGGGDVAPPAVRAAPRRRRGLARRASRR